MESIKRHKELLEQILKTNGESFEYDENAILEEFQQKDNQTATLAIKILSVFGGLMATLAFLGFLVIVGLYKSELGLVTFGIGFLAVAIGLNKLSDSLLLDTFCITLYISGFLMLAFGLHEFKMDENLIALLISFIALSSLLITQNFMLSFISIMTVSSSFLYLIFHNSYYNIIHFYLALYAILICCIYIFEAKLIASHKKLANLYAPLRIGSIFSFLLGLLCVGKKDAIPVSENYIWISSIFIISLLIYLISDLLKVLQIKKIKNKVMVYILSILILSTTLFSPAISGALLIILLSFKVHHKTGFAIGIIALLYFISQYYYDLSFTLLTKSIMLMISGIGFLLLYVITNKAFKDEHS